MRVRPWLRTLKRGHRPIRFGSLTSTAPISEAWGFDRGKPVDRWYIERFLERHRDDITGRVLEVGDSAYTNRFGADVSRSDVLDIDPTNQAATFVADLASQEDLPADLFDCFILTQTLQYVFDVRAAIANAHRLLRAGGVLLLTVPVVGRIEYLPLADYWRFTPDVVSRLLEARFGADFVEVEEHGNVLTQVAFLEGLAAEELTTRELEADDKLSPLIVCAKAVKSENDEAAFSPVEA